MGCQIVGFGRNSKLATLTKYQCTKEGEILHVILTDKGN